MLSLFLLVFGFLSFIDQACSVNMAGFWPPFFASLWTSTPSWSINLQKKNILTSRLVNNPYIPLRQLTKMMILLQKTTVNLSLFSKSSKWMISGQNAGNSLENLRYVFISGRVTLNLSSG